MYFWYDILIFIELLAGARIPEAMSPAQPEHPAACWGGANQELSLLYIHSNVLETILSVSLFKSEDYSKLSMRC